MTKYFRHYVDVAEDEAVVDGVLRDGFGVRVSMLDSNHSAARDHTERPS